MIWFRRGLLALAFGVAAAALAQPPNLLLPQPRITVAFPPGGKAGSTVALTVTGTDLDRPAGLWFSHPGIRAERIAEPVPAVKKKDDKGKAGTKAPPSAPPQFKVTIPDSVPPGMYDVRFVGQHGISNPRAFVVGSLPEVSEVEPNNDVPEAQRITFGTTVNGAINSPTDVDYCLFAGKAGQRVRVFCTSGRIDGRARPLVELFDAKSQRRIGSARAERGADVVAEAVLRTDGDVLVRVCEFAYQFGGPDSIYRLTVFDGSVLDAAYPPVAVRDQATSMTLHGPGIDPSQPAKVTPRIPADALISREWIEPARGLFDGFDLRHPTSINAQFIPLARAPLVRETDQTHDTPATAQTVTAPCEVYGRIESANNRDWYRFSARKGETLYIDLAADRLGSPIDPVLTLVNDANNQEIVGENQLDDEPDSLHPIGFFTRSADPPSFRFVAPADGTYRIRVATRDGAVSFGPRAIYRLRIAPPHPDFRVVAMPRSRELPSSVVVRPGLTTAIDVYVHRIDGFNGPVAVNAIDLPKGLQATPAFIGTNQRWGSLLLTAEANAEERIETLMLQSSAVLDGKTVTHPVRSATITWPINQNANVPTITRLDQSLPVAVRKHLGTPGMTLQALVNKATIKGKDGKDTPIKAPFAIKAGDKLTLPVAVEWKGEARANPVTLNVDPTHPDNQRSPLAGNNANVTGTIAKDKTDAPMTFEIRNSASPGRYRFMVRGETQAPYTKGEDKAKANAALLAWIPIDVQVVPTTLARVSAGNVSVRPGSTAELTVRLERQFEYGGSYFVSLKLPGERGLSATSVTVPSGSDEAKIRIRAASDAKPGSLPNVTVTVTATLDGVTVNQESTITLTIPK